MRSTCLRGEVLVRNMYLISATNGLKCSQILLNLFLDSYYLAEQSANGREMRTPCSTSTRHTDWLGCCWSAA